MSFLKWEKGESAASIWGRVLALEKEDAESAKMGNLILSICERPVIYVPVFVPVLDTTGERETNVVIVRESQKKNGRKEEKKRGCSLYLIVNGSVCMIYLNE